MDGPMDNHLDLATFVTKVSGAHNFRIEESLGSGLVRLNVTEAQKRQALQDIQSVEDGLIELVRNARDAHASTIYIASQKEGSQRTLVVIDDGVGVPEFAHDLIFEPRVTSKLNTLVNDSWGVHGRGMALYSIKSRAVNAHLCCSGPALGSSISVTFETSTVPERTDQSSWPQRVKQSEEGVVLVGPHNLLRAAVELAFECDQSTQPCRIFYGSPLQIAATMLKRSRMLFTTDQLADVGLIDSIPLVHRLAFALDPSELTKICSQLGIEISLRSAQRLFSGQIRPVAQVLTQVKMAQDKPVKKPVMPRAAHQKLPTTSIRLKPTPYDLEALKEQMSPCLRQFAQRQYHQLHDHLDICVRGSSLTITARFYPEDL